MARYYLLAAASVEHLMSLIQRLLGIQPKTYFSKKQFGPQYRFFNSGGHQHLQEVSFEKDNIEILDGPLKNTVFKIECEITDCQLRLFLKTSPDQTDSSLTHGDNGNSVLIGRVLCDRNPHTGEIIYWDVMVQEKFRMKGLASLMTKIALRQLITIQKKIKFMIRMVQLYRPTDKSIKLQNVGIGVIAHRLGLHCEFDLSKLLNPLNIQNIEVLSPETVFPPSYKIILKTYPYVLIGFIIDPETLKPITNQTTYYEMLKQTGIIEEWIRNKAIIIGNGNYLLRKDGVKEFINCIANDEKEAEFYLTKILHY